MKRASTEEERRERGGGSCGGEGEGVKEGLISCCESSGEKVGESARYEGGGKSIVEKEKKRNFNKRGEVINKKKGKVDTGRDC